VNDEKEAEKPLSARSKIENDPTDMKQMYDDWVRKLNEELI